MAFGAHGRLMILRTGYFDDSGKIYDRPSVVIAGFIGNENQLETLHQRWGPLLRKYGLDYFRGSECESGNKQFDKTVSAKWSDPNARSDCRMDFVSAIIEAGLSGFACGVVSADYKALSRQDQRRIGKPFALVAQTLIITVKDWANECQIYDLFPYLFEAGSDGYPEFSQIFNRVMEHEIRRNAYRMLSCGLVGKECIPAQAADLLAYEYSHCMHSVIDENDAGFKRPAVRELNKKLRIETRYHDSQTLAKVLAQPKSEYRPFK